MKQDRIDCSILHNWLLHPVELLVVLHRTSHRTLDFPAGSYFEEVVPDHKGYSVIEDRGCSLGVPS